MSDDLLVCTRMSDEPDVPHRKRVPHKARASIARSAMDFVQLHGAEYPDKASALEAFKRQYADDRASASAGEKPGHTNVVGVGIFTTIVVSLCCFFFERWWARTFPNG